MLAPTVEVAVFKSLIVGAPCSPEAKPTIPFAADVDVAAIYEEVVTVAPDSMYTIPLDDCVTAGVTPLKIAKLPFN